MSKKKLLPQVPVDGLEVKLVLRNGKVRDLPNLPEGVRVEIYDYDLDKYTKDRLEPDPEGKSCVAAIWTRFAPKNTVNHTVRVAVKKRDVEVVKCPKCIRVVVIHEDKVERK
jgi:hypothetical protein